MLRIAELHLDYPFAGSRMMRHVLVCEGRGVGRLHVATMMPYQSICFSGAGVVSSGFVRGIRNAVLSATQMRTLTLAVELYLLVFCHFSSPVWSEGLPWTSKAVRIDRNMQNFERIAPKDSVVKRPMNLPLAINRDLQVLDSANFRLGQETYHIGGLVGLDANQICRDTFNRQWACGVRGRATLRYVLLQRRMTRCYVENDMVIPVVVECLYAGRPLRDFLLAASLALPAD